MKLCHWVLLTLCAFSLLAGCKSGEVSEKQAKDFGLTPEERAAGKQAGEEANQER